ncbi:SDR family oxidoreductase [Tenacibaculum tangerinum]|uniref:SDR family oxidoreductase n=1 Tax=Tenacibaculum tangerinum TaxID=3038772 RepID=A0ABY8L4Y5_9FLAO|nr:SDR family oxidoreductase [Tenacibaculum tangerinum]WGH76450.1 SDR family oxidoreductase [Tenacibaculum tangerinum]
MEAYDFTKEEWEHCIKVLKALKENPYNNPNNQLFSGLITKVYKKAKKLKSRELYENKREEDLETLKSSIITKNALNNKTLFSDESIDFNHKYQELKIPKNCYSCNESYTKVHFFYNRMCPKCSEENYRFRFSTVNLKGRNVILTGGRVKVGYATALKVLRNKGNLLVTTRFPALALEQLKKEKDYKEWKDRLTIYGLDLKNLKAVEEFISYCKLKYTSLDILINNAAQTIKYNDSYYQPLIQNETKLLAESADLKLVPNHTPIVQERLMIEKNEEYQSFAMNRFGQPIDQRIKTSWNSTLEEVSMYELLEVNIINQIAPYFLIKELTPLFKESSFKEQFIINVTSSEGIFSYYNKTKFHPHTNMTKAALNMMTRTSGEQYATEYGIYMYAVDVGWISTGAKESLREKQFEKAYVPPLDSVDGAARILHPIVEGIKETPILAGTLLKNYKIENW